MGTPIRHASISNVDFLRGIAAIAVLVWHYQHFFYPQAAVGLKDRSIQPFFTDLRWLYEYGGHGVQFFWILSGFVFFHAYQGRQDVNFREFVINRFSRLYPLHLATLLLVAALQFVSFRILGHYQIYPLNDLYHFLLNLFMISHWGLQKGWSFNAPIWSVSVEIIIYGLFFAYIKSTRITLLTAIAWFILSWVAFQGISSTNAFSQCALLFIMGGVVHQLHIYIGRLLPSLVCALLSSGVLALAIYALYLKGGWNQSWVYFGIFPASIWMCASFERLGVSFGKAGHVVGNLTYASYLIHIPIQIAVMTAMDTANLDRISIVQSPSFFVVFLIVVCLISYWIFQNIELPLKQFIRQRFFRSRTSTAFQPPQAPAG